MSNDMQSKAELSQAFQALLLMLVFCCFRDSCSCPQKTAGSLVSCSALSSQLPLLWPGANDMMI